MRKHDLAARLARRARTSKASAADRIDSLIHDILAELKQGNPVALPGLGRFKPGKTLTFKFEPEKRAERPKGEKNR